jgi:hypothetical protein
MTFDVPVQMNIDSVTTGTYTGFSGEQAGVGVLVQYEKNTALGVFTLWGASPNTTTNTTLTEPPPGLGAGEYVTRVRWEYGQATPGASATINPTVRGQIINPDNAGNPVTTNTAIQAIVQVNGIYTAGPTNVNDDDVYVFTPTTATIAANTPTTEATTTSASTTEPTTTTGTTGTTTTSTATTAPTTTSSTTTTTTSTTIPVNDAPSAADDSYSTAEDRVLTVAAPGVLGNDTDVDGDTLSAVVVDEPSNGTLTLNADGSFTYTPAANFTGTDSFTYQAGDGALDSNPATVMISVTRP